ncbi:hypothetical protein KR767_18880 [Luteibacter anthropi]|uniref:hypothetical protein n=1 Tax=Luteibacter anthropi TaxID=564369 RepID=UPI00203293EB|nr:hypothetical protein [Luteibacter anthropi]URX62086.1 hypothetical protein KR767_18880 [Luteibacter anthropi]
MTPVFRLGGLQAFVLSPMVWITIILCITARRHLNIVTRMRRAGHGPAIHGNHIGNIHAAGNVHIHQTVVQKPIERAGSGAVMAALLSALAAIICELIKAWMLP